GVSAEGEQRSEVSDVGDAVVAQYRDHDSQNDPVVAAPRQPALATPIDSRTETIRTGKTREPERDGIRACDTPGTKSILLMRKSHASAWYSRVRHSAWLLALALATLAK